MTGDAQALDALEPHPPLAVVPVDVQRRRKDLRQALGRVRRALATARRVPRVCGAHTPRVSETIARLTHADSELLDAIDDTIDWRARSFLAYGTGVTTALAYLGVLWLAGRPILDSLSLAVVLLLLVPNGVFAVMKNRDARAIPVLPADQPRRPEPGQARQWLQQVSRAVQQDAQAARELVQAQLPTDPTRPTWLGAAEAADHAIEQAARATTLWPGDTIRLTTGATPSTLRR